MAYESEFQALWHKHEALADATEAAEGGEATEGEAAPEAAEETPEAEATAEAAEVEAEAGEEKPEKPEKSAKPRREVVENTESGLEELKALAKKHGYRVDGTAVVTAERAKLREDKRRIAESLKAQQQEHEARIQQELQQHGPQIERARQIQAAAEAGDLEGIAKALDYESWEKLQDSAITQAMDPNFKKVRELERWKQAQERAEKDRQEQTRQQQLQQKRTEAQQQYIRGLASEMKESEHQALSVLHEDPWFLQAVFHVQSMHWDNETQSTMTPEEVLEWQNPQTGKSLRQQLERTRDLLNRALGKSEPAAEKPNGKTKARPKAPKTGVMSKAEASEASGPKRWDPVAEKEAWLEQAKRRMLQSDSD